MINKENSLADAVRAAAYYRYIRLYNNYKLAMFLAEAEVYATKNK